MSDPDELEELPLDDLPEDTDETKEPEAPDTAAELASLKAEVEKLKGFDSLAADLRRSVGRIQSLEAQLERVSDPAKQNAIVEQANKQFGSVTELLASVVENIDDTALDAATKQRVRDAYQTSQRAAERASLREEILAEVRPKPAPQPQSSLPNGLTPELLATQERMVVRQLERAGLDPDKDYDWKAASTILANGGSVDQLLDLADKAIEAATAEQRRQDSKRRAGPGSPSGASPSGDLADRLEGAKTLDEGVAILRAMGVNV